MALTLWMPAVSLLILIPSSTPVSASVASGPVVNTTLGKLQGMTKEVKGHPVDVYYGIPFAKPPVGDLRFKHPRPADPWKGVRPAFDKPNACFQTVDTSFNRFPGADMWNPNTPISEDCLYLNIWVPPWDGIEPPRATMVWIYGGGFYAGSSMLDVYDGAILAVTENVVVVSVNYRVGPLGLLYTGTQDAPGNQGLMDQALALHWLQQNLRVFGGNPNAVTIFGESAGAISAGLHLLSPMSIHLFTRAILQSGSAYMSTNVKPASHGVSGGKELARLVGCPNQPAQAMVSCMRRVDAGQLTEAQWRLGGLLKHFVDGLFLPDSPRDMMARGKAKATQILLGANKNEGMFFLMYKFPDHFPYNASMEPEELSLPVLKEIVGSIAKDDAGDDEAMKKKVTEALLAEYSDNVVPSLRDSYRIVADQILGDQKFTCPVVDFAADFGALGHRRKVYLYSFDHVLSSNPWPHWMGALHGYEIEAVFGLPPNSLYPQHSYTDSEMALTARMMQYWTRFAKTGNPNPTRGPEVWPRMTSQGLEYLRIADEKDSVEQGLRYRQCSFRKKILPLLDQGANFQHPVSEMGASGHQPVNGSHYIIIFTCAVLILGML